MTTPTTPAALTVARHPDRPPRRHHHPRTGRCLRRQLFHRRQDPHRDGGRRNRTRTSGSANGNRKTADIWHPVTDATPADAAPADAAPADAAADAGAVAPVSGAPGRAASAGFEGADHGRCVGWVPGGITADAAINESGLSVAMGDTILAAVEVSGAARRLPTEPDGTELWVPVADADLAKVDPANAPTHTTCPTCGHVRKIRAPPRGAPPAPARAPAAVPVRSNRRVGEARCRRAGAHGGGVHARPGHLHPA
jgi:hypothetical protein